MLRWLNRWWYLPVRWTWNLECVGHFEPTSFDGEIAMVSRDCHNVNNNKKASPYSTVSRKAVVLLECWQSQHIAFRNEYEARWHERRSKSKINIFRRDGGLWYHSVVPTSEEDDGLTQRHVKRRKGSVIEEKMKVTRVKKSYRRDVNRLA